MRAGTLTAILSIVAAILLALCIALPIVASYFHLVLRDFFGTFGGTSLTGAEYNSSDFESVEELEEYETKTIRQMGGEGYVLLKNSSDAGKGLPLAAGSTVSLFSHSSVDIISGGTGSGTSEATVTLKDAFEAADFKVNSTLWNFYSTGAGKGYTRGAGSTGYGAGEAWKINECPLSVLQSNDVLSSATGTTAIYVLSRTGGEGRDLPRGMANWTDIEQDKDKSYLEPDSVELGIIDYLNKNFNNVIIIVNTNNAMELGWVEDYSNITAVLWAPGGGSETAYSIVDVLSGKVSPSGHLVDTFAYDAFSSPAMQNMGDIRYTVNGQAVDYYGVSYDEGIYVGYKYYETRYYDKVAGQGNAGDYDYATTVQYPFGYGLSYTDFTWSNYSVSSADGNGNITVSVDVKNTGSVAGKEVVEVYLQSPYTSYDKMNYVEKSAVTLIGYEKTAELAPGESETVKVSVNISDFVSYDDYKAKTYILDEGDYLITAASDAHVAANNFLVYNNITSGLSGTGDKNFVGSWNNPTFDKTTYATSSSGEAITNRFDGVTGVTSSNYIDRDKYLSRQDWTGTWPETHGKQNGSYISGYPSERSGGSFYEEISSELYAKLQKSGDAEAANSPITDEQAAAKKTYDYAESVENDGSLQLIDLRGADYDDPRWDTLISMMTAREAGKIIGLAGYTTEKATSINKPVGVDLDGPAGLNAMVGHGMAAASFPAEVNIAASWNKTYSYEHGRLVAEDGLREAASDSGSSTASGAIASGWYAPAMNIHRSPFVGRNFEYYSEDSYMSGSMAAKAVKGAADNGMYAFIKHFALNDQENHRCDNGLATWCNEQAMREIYLKPFQMSVETSGTVDTMYYVYDSEKDTSEDVETAQTPACLAVMSSFNRVGATWTGGDYRLITEILRNEWGYNGTVLTDYNSYSYMPIAQFLRAGADTNLTQYGNAFSIKTDANVYYSQQAMHHVLYTVVNSNAMNGFVHGTVVNKEPFAKYKLIVIAFEVVFVVGILICIYFILKKWGIDVLVLLHIKKPKAVTENTADSENAADGKNQS